MMGFNMVGMTIEFYTGLMLLKHKINLHVFNVYLNHFIRNCKDKVLKVVKGGGLG